MLQTYMQVVGLLKNLRYDFNMSILNNMENSKFLKFSNRLFLDIETIFTSSKIISSIINYVFKICVMFIIQFRKLVFHFKIQVVKVEKTKTLLILSHKLRALVFFSKSELVTLIPFNFLNYMNYSKLVNFIIFSQSTYKFLIVRTTTV